jgi:hypothetical protein
MSADVELQAAGGSGPGPAFQGVAYSGGPLKLSGFRQPVIIDLAGLEAKQPIALLVNHDSSIESRVGQCEVENTGRKLRMSGTFNATEKAKGVVALWKSTPEPRSCAVSVGVQIMERREIEPGETVHVNGETHVAGESGLIVVTRGRLREISVVGLGADEDGQINIAAQAAINNKGVTVMEDTDINSEVLEKERNRVSEIEAMCRGEWGEFEGEVDELRAQAMSGDLDNHLLGKRLLEIVRARRPHAPAVHTRREPTTDVFAAAMLMAAGQSDIAEAEFDEATCEQANAMGATNAVDITREVLRSTGRSVPRDNGEMVQAAFSTSTVGNILGGSTKAALHRGYQQAEQTWRKVARILPTKDLHDHTAIRPYTDDSLLDEVGQGGELKHTSLGEKGYPVSMGTYGRLTGFTRRTIINDSIGEIFELQRAIGLAAGRTLNKHVWTTIRDATGHFLASNSNYITGADTALSVAGLSKAVAALREQVDDGDEPIGLQVGSLIAPPALEATARSLLKSTEIDAGEGYATGNPWKDLAELVVVPHLAAAHAGSDKAWYLAATPASCPTVIVGLLNGNDRPTLEEMTPSAEYLGIQFRCYMDWGVALADPKAAVKSKGEA